MTYAAIIPGLLARRPKESQDTKMGRQGLMDANAAYQGMQNSFRQQADTYGGKFGDASSQYLDLLSRPVGSDAEDAAILGRAREDNQQNARRASARIANNPALAGGSGQAGALSSIAQRQLASNAQLNARVADMNLMQRRQRQQTIVDFLARQLARTEGGYAQALAGGTNISSGLLTLGRGQDQANLASSMGSTQGLMAMLAQMGQAAGDKGK